MEREVKTFTFEQFHNILFPDKPYIPPFSGKCTLCAKNLTSEDKDHSVCNTCWDETFAEQEDYDPGDEPYVDV